MLGPTASGKTALAVTLAKRFGGEILSADSRQVYNGLDIGTGKDLSEYGSVPFHLIDIVSLPNEYNVFRFKQDFASALKDVLSRKRLPIVAGGTGLYIESITADYSFTEAPKNIELRRSLSLLDEAALLERLALAKAAIGEKVHPDDTAERERIIRAIEIAESSGSSKRRTTSLKDNFCPLIIGTRFPRSELRERIEKRLDERLALGLLEEVRRVHEEEGISWERLERLGLEYRHATQYLQGKTAFSSFRQGLLSDICRFAKRQETWFRRMERRGAKIHWIARGNADEAISALLEAGFKETPCRKASPFTL